MIYQHRPYALIAVGCGNHNGIDGKGAFTLGEFQQGVVISQIAFYLADDIHFASDPFNRAMFLPIQKNKEAVWEKGGRTPFPILFSFLRKLVHKMRDHFAKLHFNQRLIAIG